MARKAGGGVGAEDGVRLCALKQAQFKCAMPENVGRLTAWLHVPTAPHVERHVALLSARLWLGIHRFICWRSASPAVRQRGPRGDGARPRGDLSRNGPRLRITGQPKTDTRGDTSTHRMHRY